MERNIYLSETHKGIRHSYSYDMQTGKYYLESGESNKQFIHKIGKLQNKFRPDGSGVWNTKKRLQFVKENPENEIHRHYVPDQVYHQSKSFYTPIPRKFNGYAQRPRSFKDDGLPSHLKSQTPLSRKAKHPSHSTLNKKSTIQLGKTQPSMTEPLQSSLSQIPFFRSSLISMVNSRPGIRKPKRSCYNNRCHDANYKQLQYSSIIDELNKSLNNARESTKVSDFAASKSFVSKMNHNNSTGF